MRVLVLGGYGLIGTAAVSRLLVAGHSVVGLGRSVAAARRRHPKATWAEHDIAKLLRPEDWRPLIVSIDAVVNCAGALQDSARDDVRAIQSTAMRALFLACAQAGVRRVVQISAAGASADAPTAFMQTKADADMALAESDLDWVILRPGLVIAPAAYGATALLRALASMPLAVPLTNTRRLIQTVHVDDVADAVLLVVQGHVASRAVYDLVEEKRHTLDHAVSMWRAWLGYAPAPVVAVPSSLARLASRVGDALGALGWRSPLRSTTLRQLEAGITGDPNPWAKASNRRLSGLAENLGRLPATVQERWFGRLWLLKPVIVATLSLFWVATGVLGLARLDVAASLLTARGIGAQAAVLAVVSGSVLDLLLGLAAAFRRSMAWAALGMCATTALYLAAGTVVAPELWADPLGPYVKTIPGAVLALVACAIADER